MQNLQRQKPVSVNNLSTARFLRIFQRNLFKFPHIDVKNRIIDIHIVPRLATSSNVIYFFHTVRQRRKHKYEFDTLACLLTDKEARVKREVLDISQLIAITSIMVTQISFTLEPSPPPISIRSAHVFNISGFRSTPHSDNGIRLQL